MLYLLCGVWIDQLVFAARLRALFEDGRVSPKEGVLLPMPLAMREKVLRMRILCIISDCDVDPFSVLLAFAPSGDVDWAARDAVG